MHLIVLLDEAIVLKLIGILLAVIAAVMISLEPKGENKTSQETFEKV